MEMPGRSKVACRSVRGGAIPEGCTHITALSQACGRTGRRQAVHYHLFTTETGRQAISPMHRPDSGSRLYAHLMEGLLLDSDMLRPERRFVLAKWRRSERQGRLLDFSMLLVDAERKKESQFSREGGKRVNGGSRYVLSHERVPKAPIPSSILELG